MEHTLTWSGVSSEVLVSPSKLLVLLTLEAGETGLSGGSPKLSLLHTKETVLTLRIA